MHFAQLKAVVYCYHEFKLRYLKNQKLFSIRVKELFEPIHHFRINRSLAGWAHHQAEADHAPGEAPAVAGEPPGDEAEEGEAEQRAGDGHRRRILLVDAPQDQG